MIVLYMFCASFMVKDSATIMQSVNIHIIKIFNKTCRLGNQNIGLNLYIFKTFFLLRSPFFSSLFPSPPLCSGKHLIASGEVSKTRK